MPSFEIRGQIFNRNTVSEASYQSQMVLLGNGGNPDVIFRNRCAFRPEVIFKEKSHSISNLAN
jgi:hypothetical protein